MTWVSILGEAANLRARTPQDAVRRRTASTHTRRRTHNTELPRRPRAAGGGRLLNPANPRSDCGGRDQQSLSARAQRVLLSWWNTWSVPERTACALTESPNYCGARVWFLTRRVEIADCLSARDNSSCIHRCFRRRIDTEREVGHFVGAAPLAATSSWLFVVANDIAAVCINALPAIRPACKFVRGIRLIASFSLATFPENCEQLYRFSKQLILGVLVWLISIRS